jgi:hypothetical protein
LGDEIQLRGSGRETHGNVQICAGVAYASVMPSFFSVGKIFGANNFLILLEKLNQVSGGRVM